jgi:hypothetical protein
MNQVNQASQAFEKFLQSEDRLARLLCELPVYAPSAEAEFAAIFARAARAAQAQQEVMRTETAAGQVAASGTARLESTRLDAMPSAFEAPASLEAAFLKMAASVQSAQAPRREAILNGIAKGDSPQAMLGAAIAPSSEEWLRAQAPAAGQTHEARQPAPPTRKRSFLGLRWFDLRLAALACVLAVVGTQLALIDDPDPTQIAVQEAFEKPLAKRDSSKEADLAHDARGPLADAQLALNQSNGAMLQSRQDKARLAAAEGEAAPSALKKSEARPSAPRAQFADAIDAPNPESPSPPPPVTPAPAGKLAVAEAIELPARLAAGKVARPSALASGMADKVHAEARSAPPAAARMAVPASRPEQMTASGIPDSRKEKAAPREHPIGQIAAQETKQRADESPAEEPAGATAAMPRPATVAAGPAQTNRQQASDSGISATLADDPARIATLLPSRPAGAVWSIYNSQPRQPELARWLEALRRHIPESGRPARFELIKDEAGPSPMQLRIVPPALSEWEAEGRF